MDSRRDSVCSDGSYLPTSTPSLSNCHSFSSDIQSSDTSRSSVNMPLYKVINQAEVQMAIAKLASLRDKYEHERISSSSEYGAVQLLQSKLNQKSQDFTKQKRMITSQTENLAKENADLEEEIQNLNKEYEKLKLENQYNLIKKKALREEIIDMQNASDMTEIERLQESIEQLNNHITDLRNTDITNNHKNSFLDLNKAEEDQLTSTI